eukprot:gene10454-2512_t
MEEDEPEPAPAAAPAPAQPPAPWHAAARIIPTTQHAELLFAQQWEHPIRVYGDSALGRVRGGADATDPGILEVTPPGAAATVPRDMYRHHWIANVGARTAWFSITPKLEVTPAGRLAGWGIRVACLNVNGIFGEAERGVRMGGEGGIESAGGGPSAWVNRHTTTLTEVRLALTYAPPDDGANGRGARAAVSPMRTGGPRRRAAAPCTGTVRRLQATASCDNAKPQRRAVASCACGITLLGTGIAPTHQGRDITPVLGPGIEVMAYILWPPGIVSDHALVIADVGNCDGIAPLPPRTVWRSVDYKAHLPKQKLEWALAASLMTRHMTVHDPVEDYDICMSAAALLALPKTNATTLHKHGLGLMSDKDTLRCTQVVQWIAARHRGDPANIIPRNAATPARARAAAHSHMRPPRDGRDAGRFPALRPTEDAAADVLRGTAVFRDMRSLARRKAGERRKKKYEVRKKWEAECLPTQRGVTQRLMKKPGLRLVSILERSDGTMAAGEDLLSCAHEQAQGRRSDSMLRHETMAALRDFPGDRQGPPLTVSEATNAIFAMKSSAPGVSGISSVMLQTLAAWAPRTWSMWVRMQNKWRGDLARFRFVALLFRVLEMRLSKGKKQNIMEAQRPVGMEPERMRLEQKLGSDELNAAPSRGARARRSAPAHLSRRK